MGNVVAGDEVQDHRDQERIEHPQRELLAQRIFGHEQQNTIAVDDTSDNASRFVAAVPSALETVVASLSLRTPLQSALLSLWFQSQARI
jgi:hypothetical protein